MSELNNDDDDGDYDDGDDDDACDGDDDYEENRNTCRAKRHGSSYDE